MVVKAKRPVLATVELRRRMIEEIAKGKSATAAEAVQTAYVFLFVLKGRVRSAVDRVVTWIKETLAETFRPLPIIAGLVGSVLGLLRHDYLREHGVRQSDATNREPRASST